MTKNKKNNNIKLLDGIYLMKPRLHNKYSFCEVIKKDKVYHISIFFKSGTIFKEIWTENDFKYMLENNLIRKYNKIDWSILNE